MDEILIVVETCSDSGQLIASWDEPSGNGGISTQATDLRDLQGQVDDAVVAILNQASCPSRSAIISCPIQFSPPHETSA